MRNVSSPNVPPRLMTDVTLSQANPVANTLYPLLPTTRNAKIWSAVAQIQWTVQPTPLQVILTIDGKIVVHGFTNPATVTSYAVVHGVAEDYMDENNQLLAIAYSAAIPNPLYEGKTVRVDVRTGSVTAGTTQNLTARLKYSQY